MVRPHVCIVQCGDGRGRSRGQVGPISVVSLQHSVQIASLTEMILHAYSIILVAKNLVHQGYRVEMTVAEQGRRMSVTPLCPDLPPDDVTQSRDPIATRSDAFSKESQ